jgi:hypothetical protein
MRPLLEKSFLRMSRSDFFSTKLTWMDGSSWKIQCIHPNNYSSARSMTFGRLLKIRQRDLSSMLSSHSDICLQMGFFIKRIALLR